MYQSFKMALKAIAGNKMRSFLTVLGVIIGVVAIVVLVAIAQGATNTISSSIESMGTNMLTVSIRARRQNPVTMAGLDELSQDVSIAAIAPYTSVSGTIKAGVNTYDDGSAAADCSADAPLRAADYSAGSSVRAAHRSENDDRHPVRVPDLSVWAWDWAWAEAADWLAPAYRSHCRNSGNRLSCHCPKIQSYCPNSGIR
ncbi:MAG: ABC transporter permease [Clostridia bacterium]|nr:ABC transporter permease [Clostridia bacterium]